MMKKLLAVVIFLFEGLTIIAQGTWSTGMNEADELKGFLGGPYYRYDVEGMGSFILWDWEDWKFRIITDKGTFDVQSGSIGKYVSYSMGLYTLDGQLTDKFENWIEADNTSYNTATVNTKWWYAHSPKKKIKKMLQALKSGEGYVRIVCKRYNEQDFDLKITKYDIPEKYSTAYKEYTQVLERSVYLYDYNSPNEIVAANRNKEQLKYSILKKGERFKVVTADRPTMSAKIQLPNGKVGWVYAPFVPNKRDLIPYFPFRNQFLPNIETAKVALGMTREEVLIVTGNYLQPGDKSYKAFGDYIWYNYTNANYLFYKNSLFFSTSNNGAFYYQCFVNYQLNTVSRNEFLMDKYVNSASNHYSDELLSVLWSIDRNKVNFTVKNKAHSSIKILWDDMAFVGINGESHRVIHKGIKYSEKEKEQAPSIIARNAELHDLIIPADKIYFQKSWEKWSAYPFVDDYLYSPEDESTKHPNGKKIQVLLPIIVNEKRYEYQFVFEISKMNFMLTNRNYYKDNRLPDEL